MNILNFISALLPSGQTSDPPEGIEHIAEESMGFFSSLKGLSFDDAVTKIANGLVSFAFKLLIAILVFYVGKFIIKKLYKVTLKLMTARSMDPSLITFVLSLVRITLYFILIIIVVGILGIETSSFIALFASAGVAIGLALSGTLQNFAGGVLILLLKPYKVGDYIETQGYTGTVKAIQIFNTVINTIDNKAIILPNGSLSNASINNYSLESYRQVEWVIGLSYDTDYSKAKECIVKMLLQDDRVVERFIEDDRLKRIQNHLEEEESKQEQEIRHEMEQTKELNFFRRTMRRISLRRKYRKAAEIHSPVTDVPVLAEKVERRPFVGLKELADSSINITVRAWTHASNYWPLFYEMNERFYTELPQNGFSFPFPQMDVHMNTVES